MCSLHVWRNLLQLIARISFGLSKSKLLLAAVQVYFVLALVERYFKLKLLAKGYFSRFAGD